jgi:hypothetical protein
MSLFIEKPYLKEEPPGLKKASRQRRCQDFLVSNSSMNANGNSPPWICSSARIATAIVHNVRKFSWQQKKDLNATERMHAHFCMILRRIG